LIFLHELEGLHQAWRDMGFLTKRAFISLYFEEVGVCANLLWVRAKREEVLLSGVLQDFEIQRLLVA